MKKHGNMYDIESVEQFQIIARGIAKVYLRSSIVIII